MIDLTATVIMRMILIKIINTLMMGTGMCPMGIIYMAINPTEIHFTVTVRMGMIVPTGGDNIWR